MSLTPVPAKKPSKRRMESQIQTLCVKWFRYQYSSRGYLIYAIPNGGLRSKVEAAIMNGEGVLAGMPDTHIPVSNGKYLTLYVEFKVPGETWSKDQEVRRDELRALDHCVELAHSIDEFIKIVTDYFNAAKV